MKLANVNTTDIRDAITLGCQTMSGVFNADDNNIPFFGSSVRPQAGFEFHQFHSESHIPGRHLNALLNAGDVLGIAIEESVIEKHRDAALFSYSGVVPLPLNRDKIGGRLVNFAPHNLREGFHALYSLLAFRASHRAHEVAEASIAAILTLWNPDSGWDRKRLEKDLGLSVIDFDSPFIGGIARVIGPLVKYYRVTGSAPALYLATLVKDKALAEYFLPGGHCDIGRLGTHTHSITCVLSSLAQLAAETRDAPLMARVREFYDNGLREISNALGWSPENARPTDDPARKDRGEANNTGDILETALILGRWGYTDCYRDAERILRGHLLPSQLRDISFIREPENPDSRDALRNVARRHLGAFGFPAPYGHEPIQSPGISFNLDIVGGAVASLCAAYREVTRFEASDGHVVNLLFDHETPEVSVRSPYTNNGVLAITTKRQGPLKVRLPTWQGRQETIVEGIRDKSAPFPINGYLYVPEPLAGTISISMPPVREEMTLTYGSRRIRTRMNGDSVEAMENFGADLTFFDPLSR